MSPNPILVTGATGTIGSSVVRMLADKDVSVRAMTRNPEDAGWLGDLNIELVQGDFLAPETVASALQGIETAFLLSPNVKRMAEMQSNFVAAADQEGIEHIVKLSAAGANPTSSWDIARWHGKVEEEIDNSDIEQTFIRPVSYMQNLLDDVETIQSDGFFARATPPDSRINVVDTRDVAQVAVESLLDNRHRGEIYKPTGPEPITFEQMARVLSTVTGTSVEFREISPKQARQSLREDDTPEWLIESMVGLQVAFGTGIADLNTDHVVQVTGDQPRSFETFARDHRAAFSSE